MYFYFLGKSKFIQKHEQQNKNKKIAGVPYSNDLIIELHTVRTMLSDTPNNHQHIMSTFQHHQTC